MKRIKQLTIALLLVTGIMVYSSHLTTAQLTTDCGSGALTSFPAFADGVTDDAAAFRQGLEALAQCGGGTLHVPAGKFMVRSNVTVNFLHRAQQIIIRGNGSSSQIHISTGPTVDAFVLQDVDSLWERLMVVGGGINGAYTSDALNAFRISGGRGTFQYNHFVGLGALTSSSAYLPATIRFDHGARAVVSYNEFWGCRSISALYSGTIVADNYTGFEAVGNKFLDYSPSYVNGNYYSTNGQANYAWIVLLTPLQDTVTHSSDTSPPVVIERNHFDEGGYFTLVILPRNGTLLYRVELNQNTINVGAGAGYVLYNIKHLEVNGGFVGLHTSGRQVDAIFLQNVHYATIRDFDISPKTLANRLTVGAGTKMLRLIDSPFPALVNNAQAWRIESGATVTTN
jgi:hypothetical protein